VLHGDTGSKTSKEHRKWVSGGCRLGVRDGRKEVQNEDAMGSEPEELCLTNEFEDRGNVCIRGGGCFAAVKK